jgi:hypothetical protein
MGKIGRKVVMTRFRRYLPLTWTALLATSAMLSVVGDASASSTSGLAPNGARACCLKRACTVCCCTPASAGSAPLTTRRSIALTGSAGSLSIPARPCECRSSEPAVPASSQESRPCEVRDGHAHGAAANLGIRAPVTLTFARLVQTTASPPRSPLYLRTARLLI